MGSFAGHFDNMIVPYQQPPNLHFKNTMVPYQLHLRLSYVEKHGCETAKKYTCIFRFSQLGYCHSTNTNVFTVRIHTNKQTYIHTDIHTYIHTYIQTYIHTYIHTDRHTYIQTKRQTPLAFNTLMWGSLRLTPIT